MMRVTDFSGFQQDIAWLTSFLASAGVVLKKGSPTALSLDALKNYADYSANGGGPLETDDIKFREQARRAFGVATHIWALQKSSAKIQSLIQQHLKVYRGAEVNLLSAETANQDRNAAWELLASCCLAHYCTDVKFEEPDLLATFQGAVLGIACKVLYSGKASTQVSRIVEGVKQIEASTAAAGFVLVNLSNVIDHDMFFRTNPLSGDYLSYPSPELAMADFGNQLMAFHNSLLDPIHDYGTRLVMGKTDGVPRKKSIGVIYYGQTLALVQRRPFLLSNAVMHRTGNALNHPQLVLEFAKNFNLAAYEMNHR